MKRKRKEKERKWVAIRRGHVCPPATSSAGSGQFVRGGCASGPRGTEKRRALHEKSSRKSIPVLDFGPAIQTLQMRFLRIRFFSPRISPCTLHKCAYQQGRQQSSNFVSVFQIKASSKLVQTLFQMKPARSSALNFPCQTCSRLLQARTGRVRWRDTITTNTGKAQALPHQRRSRELYLSLKMDVGVAGTTGCQVGSTSFSSPKQNSGHGLRPGLAGYITRPAFPRSSSIQGEQQAVWKHTFGAYADLIGRVGVGPRRACLVCW